VFCPINNTSLVCGHNDDETENHDCASNIYTGRCFINNSATDISYVAWNDPNAKLNPLHSIENKKNPFSDCWCSCPQTQVMQFVQSGNPERLEKDLPRVPPKPVILDITGNDEDDMEPFGFNQRIKLTMIPNPDTDRFKVTLEYSEARASEGDTENVDFVIKEEVTYTTSNETQVIVRNLAAGQLYTLYVTGVNAIGEGKASYREEIQIGHRMVDMNIDSTDIPILNKTSFEAQNLTALEVQQLTPFESREVPSWLEMQLLLILSVRIPQEIFRVTIHEKSSGYGSVDSLDKIEKDIHNECKNLELSSWGAKCLLESKPLGNNTKMEVRVWDDSNLLVAKNTIEVLKPSKNNCKMYDSNFIDGSCHPN